MALGISAVNALARTGGSSSFIPGVITILKK